MSITDTRPAARAFVTVQVGAGAELAIVPLHRGHHPVWGSALYRADICNMVDDWVARDLATGLLFRFPIDQALLAWTEQLITAMDDHDQATGSPWACGNVGARAVLLDVAIKRLMGYRPKRNTLEPGMVAPALTGGPTTVDDMFATIIAERPDALVDESEPGT